MNTGILYAALAYIAWGLFPLYFKQVADVPSLEVVMHRTLWSLVFVFGVLMVRRQWSWMGTVLRQPWIALVLALSFGFYGLLRKVAELGALEGLALETLVLAPVAAVVLGWWAWQGQGALVQGTPATVGWLLLAGTMTAVPLLLFAAGARLIPMSTLGILQYISPSLQFALGVWLFHEPFEPARLVGFVLIWAALLVYSMEGWWTRRRVVVA